MGKPQFNNKQQKRPSNDYFTNGIRQKGEGFMELKNAQDIQRDAIRIFRDLARGNVDIEKYGHYFLDNNVLENLIRAADSKLIIEGILRDGVTMLYNNQVSMQQPCDMTATILQNQLSKVEAYSTILNQLLGLQQTRDISWLYTLASQLSMYKYII